MMANGQGPVTYQYDVDSRLNRVTQGSLFAALEYDSLNRRISLSYSNGATTNYAYDLASRLTTIAHNGPSGVIEALTYTYDAAGNRLSSNRASGTASLLPSAVASALYDAANEQISFGSATLTYDQNGNLTSDGANTYQWDARNRLIGVTGGTTAVFAYDALGRRASKSINGASIQFIYDRNDIVAEIGGGTVSAKYLRSLSIDEPFVRQTNDGSEYYHVDALASSLALSDGSGTPITTHEYEPFGMSVNSGESSNALHYTGREEDHHGLYYYRNRYYEPRLQRFLTEDRSGLGGGDTNLYAYTGNNPIKYSDPLGLYGRDVHYDLTRWLAIQAGLQPGSANDIARANQGLDDNSGTNAITNPFAGGYWHFPSDSQLDQLRQTAMSSGGDHAALGQFLHALQDTYSHDGWYPSVPGHFFGGTEPDNVCNDLGKALEMARDTYNQLRSYRQARSGQTIPYNFDDQLVGRKIRKFGRC